MTNPISRWCSKNKGFSVINLSACPILGYSQSTRPLKNWKIKIISILLKTKVSFLSYALFYDQLDLGGLFDHKKVHKSALSVATSKQLIFPYHLYPKELESMFGYKIFLDKCHINYNERILGDAYFWVADSKLFFFLSWGIVNVISVITWISLWSTYVFILSDSFMDTLMVSYLW